MALTTDQYIYIAAFIIVPIFIAFVVKKKHSKNISKSVNNFEDLDKNHLIKSIQKEIGEMKKELTVYKIDNDQLNTRLSRLEGMFDVLRSNKE